MVSLILARRPRCGGVASERRYTLLSAHPAKSVVLLCAAAILGTCARPPSLLNEVKTLGELRVVTRNGPNTYYTDGDGATGPEYELLKGFARFLGVQLRLIVVDRATDVLPAVIGGEAHLAAAALTVSRDAEQLVDFGPVYQQVTEHLVYRDGHRRPSDLRQLRGKRLEVASGTSHVKTLALAQALNPDLIWTENPNADQQELLSRVANGSLDYTVVKSNAFAIYAATVRTSASHSISRKANRSRGLSQALRPQPAGGGGAVFRRNPRQRRTQPDHRLLLQPHAARRLRRRTREYMKDVRLRLPVYLKLFKNAGDQHGVDWRLLAAIGYQESKWDPEAVSPTGVRGLMMLTEETALTFDIDDRTDPAQSIGGGARYLAHIIGKLPEQVQEPDRTFFALAAYNIGYGHLLDARRLDEDRAGATGIAGPTCSRASGCSRPRIRRSRPGTALPAAARRYIS